MPTYEYACRTCGIVEAFQSMRDPPLTKCPSCGKSGAQRIISGGAGVIFRGDGFWETDYNRSADYKAKQKADKAPDATQSAPAPKPEPKPELKPTKSDAAPKAAPTAKPDKPAPPPKQPDSRSAG
ncbi:hypothetical protein LBMAG53_28150 [Planctomycetota bacterium]|nr:hypothetical protein LBMAG53_28150 [Planctomycetota bacterium]